MAAVPEPDLLGHLGGMLSGRVPLDAFRHWFANALWALEESADEDTLDFAYLVENRLAEYSGGHVEAADLVRALRADLDQRLAAVRRSATPQDAWRVIAPRASSTARTIDRRAPSWSAGRGTIPLGSADAARRITAPAPVILRTAGAPPARVSA